MIVDVSKINVNNSINVDFDDCFTVSDKFELINDMVNAHFTGSITNLGGSYCLNGNLTGNIIARCSRCLCEVKNTLLLEVDDKFITPNQISDDLDTFVFASENVDLSIILRENLIINIPIKVVCNEDCKGMCSVCGHNLNESDCMCDREFKDSKFAKLQSLFDNSATNSDTNNKEV